MDNNDEILMLNERISILQDTLEEESKKCKWTEMQLDITYKQLHETRNLVDTLFTLLNCFKQVNP